MSDDRYLAYLARFESEIGAIAVGGYGKWKGKLVRKLAPDEFLKKAQELDTLRSTYEKILERGDTLNDALTKVLRERQVELLVDPI